jgi:hypothetical protein
MFQTFLSLLVIDFIVTGLFFMMALDYKEKEGLPGFFAVLGLGGFFVIIFFFTALTLRKKMILSTSLSNPKSFYVIGLLRMTSLQYVEKISEANWQKIREMEIPLL